MSVKLFKPSLNHYMKYNQLLEKPITRKKQRKYQRKD